MERAVYYIFDTPPLESYYERYAMDYLIEQGWDVHAIDLSPIIYPDAYRGITEGLITGVTREVFHNKESFTLYAKEIPDGAIFIFTTDFIYDIYFVYKCIRRTQYYGYMTRTETHVEIDKPSGKDRIKGLFNKDFFKHIRNSIFIRIPRKILPIKAADFMFLGGLANRDEYIKLGYTDKNTRISHLHSLDYEQYIKVKNNKTRYIKEKYCVFLDEYVPYHPENVLVGFHIDAKKYYREINEFLSLVEKKYGVKVVIALHPRAEFSVCKNEYHNFELRQYQTAALIKDCEFVISHGSMALSFAALFCKPIVLCLTTDLLQDGGWRSLATNFAKIFSASVINISKNDGMRLPDKFDVNLAKYKEYVKQYHKSNIDLEDEPLGKLLYRELNAVTNGKING